MIVFFSHIVSYEFPQRIEQTAIHSVLLSTVQNMKWYVLELQSLGCDTIQSIAQYTVSWHQLNNQVVFFLQAYISYINMW
jgi:hypothetical protein